jgi:hypothetical protein
MSPQPSALHEHLVSRPSANEGIYTSDETRPLPVYKNGSGSQDIEKRIVRYDSHPFVTLALVYRDTEAGRDNMFSAEEMTCHKCVPSWTDSWIGLM